MTRTRKYLAAAGIAGVLAAGATLPAIAQDSPTDSTTEDTGSEERTREERHAERQRAFSEALAAELGIDVDTVEDALATVKEQMRAEREADRLARLQERLDAAVEGGELTQEQSDAIAAAAESGVFPGRGGPRGGHGPGGFGGPAPAESTDAAI